MGDTFCNKWFVYILQCSDKSLYTGCTCDIERRIKEHNSGHGGHYTKTAGRVKLLWTEAHPGKDSAFKRESQIKRWTRAKKLALANGNLKLLKKL